jgi:hypothetical protein
MATRCAIWPTTLKDYFPLPFCPSVEDHLYRFKFATVKPRIKVNFNPTAFDN